MVIKEIEVKDIMTKTNLPVSDYAVNPYVGCAHACKYCYASFMKRFTHHIEPWGEFVDIKTWPATIKFRKYAGKKVFFSSVTDPYQPIESKYMRTRTLLEQLLETGVSISISTKSDLILRDIDLIKQFPLAHVSWSINTLDENFSNEMDRAVSVERRLKAMHLFYKSGIQSTCYISPIFPGITDVISIIERVKSQCNLIILENLNLRGDYKKRILDWVHGHHPELDGLYNNIYTKKNQDYWFDLDQEILKYSTREGMLYVHNDNQHFAPFGEPPTICNYFYHDEAKNIAKKEML